MKIQALSNATPEQLFDAFRQAFSDYEIQLNSEELSAMLQRRGFDPSLSFAAWEGDKIVSFTCNGVGDFYGTPTAYDTGTGTLKDYRGGGLASQVFDYSIPFLKKAGIQNCLLEVLQHNTSAISVYRKLGFEVSREFYYYRLEKGQIGHFSKVLDVAYTLQPLRLLSPDDLSTFWDFQPSWQNSLASVERSLSAFICLGVFTEGKLIGYGIFEPLTGDVTQLAVDKAYRRQGVGSYLLKKMLESSPHEAVKIVNTDVNCSSLYAFLLSKNIKATGKQYEMIKKLL